MVRPLQHYLLALDRAANFPLGSHADGCQLQLPVQLCGDPLPHGFQHLVVVLQVQLLAVVAHGHLSSQLPQHVAADDVRCR